MDFFPRRFVAGCEIEHRDWDFVAVFLARANVERPAVGSPSNYHLGWRDPAHGLSWAAVDWIDGPAFAGAGAQEQLVIRREEIDCRIRNSFRADWAQGAF